GRYIERNLDVVQLAVEPWQYAWPSCRCYALGEADGLLAENPWFTALGGRLGSASAALAGVLAAERSARGGDPAMRLAPGEAGLSPGRSTDAGQGYVTGWGVVPVS